MRIPHSATALHVMALAAALALSGCGHSDKASDAAAPDNVEMPAEEAMSGVNPGAAPVADPAATASDAASSTPVSADSGAAAAGGAAASAAVSAAALAASGKAK